MKTIEERADEFIGHPFEIDEDSSITMARKAYIKGAQEQQAADVELIAKSFSDLLAEIGIVPRNISL